MQKLNIFEGTSDRTSWPRAFVLNLIPKEKNCNLWSGFLMVLDYWCVTFDAIAYWLDVIEMSMKLRIVAKRPRAERTTPVGLTSKTVARFK